MSPDISRPQLLLSIPSRFLPSAGYLCVVNAAHGMNAVKPITCTGARPHVSCPDLFCREIWTDLLQVMGVNGVSHHVVADDLEGAVAVLHWLSSMPPTLGVPPALLPTSDPLDRGIGYSAPSGLTLIPCS